MPSRQKLISNQIAEAFSGVVLGNGIGLYEAQALDDYKTNEVVKKYRKKDEKEHWKLLHPEELQKCHSSLSFFDADGMRFHLPAFIIASLENEVDDPLFHLTGFSTDLTQHHRTKFYDYQMSRFTTLKDLQIKAIISYLKGCLAEDIYVLDIPDIERSLKEYWEKL